jgi:hypothetical protein
MNTQTIELNINRDIITALVNGDESGLRQSDIEAIENAIAYYGPYFHVMCPNENDFQLSRCDITGSMDICALCSVVVSNAN